MRSGGLVDPRLRLAAVSVALSAALLLTAVPAHATYSIAAVDVATEQVGGAGTSCVTGPVSLVYASVPGIGVVHAQALLNVTAKARATARLEEGWEPASIIADITTAEFVTSFCKRMGILAGRWATMDEVADTVVFLASDRARYYNGAKIILDGGLNVNARPA